VPTANDRDLAPKNHYVEWSAGRQAPPDTTPPTDEFAARSAPPVPLCASPEMSLPIPLTISTTECSSKARPDCDASIANWCSVSGRVVTGAAHVRRWKERRHSQSPPLASAVVGVGEQGTSPSQACHHLDSLEWPIYGAVVALQWVPAPGGIEGETLHRECHETQPVCPGRCPIWAPGGRGWPSTPRPRPPSFQGQRLPFCTTAPNRGNVRLTAATPDAAGREVAFEQRPAHPCGAPAGRSGVRPIPDTVIEMSARNTPFTPANTQLPLAMPSRRFPKPWSIEPMPSGYRA
jgi:hypothetical protein